MTSVRQRRRRAAGVGHSSVNPERYRSDDGLRGNDDQITEREVSVLLADFALVWKELFPAEQARIVQLLVERVDLCERALEVRITAEGLASLVAEWRQQGERKAA